MPKKVPNIQIIINNDILKIVNIVFSGGQLPPLPLPLAVYGSELSLEHMLLSTVDIDYCDRNYPKKCGNHESGETRVFLHVVHLQSYTRKNLTCQQDVFATGL